MGGGGLSPMTPTMRQRSRTQTNSNELKTFESLKICGWLTGVSFHFNELFFFLLAPPWKCFFDIEILKQKGPPPLGTVRIMLSIGREPTVRWPKGIKELKCVVGRSKQNKRLSKDILYFIIFTEGLTWLENLQDQMISGTHTCTHKTKRIMSSI